MKRWISGLAVTGALLTATAAFAMGPVVYQNWDHPGGCGNTNHAGMVTHGYMRLDYVRLWYNWQAETGTTPYWLVVNGETVSTGTLELGECDEGNGNWCTAQADLGHVAVVPGTVEIRTRANYICKNQSNGNGLVKFWGSNTGDDEEGD